MTPYAKMMANSIGKAMAGTSDSALGGRMEEAVSTTMAFWGIPTKPEQTRTEEAIAVLTNQVS
ncbi:MAG: hypothetical protein BMS9Abin02_1596 [Anaerolineae bacterium]|nr:MAG: hypothetical protein BMS9Abin02_1596 [Anaerolineae bacterium]